jgi:hypothetical protein
MLSSYRNFVSEITITAMIKADATGRASSKACEHNSRHLPTHDHRLERSHPACLILSIHFPNKKGTFYRLIGNPQPPPLKEDSRRRQEGWRIRSMSGGFNKSSGVFTN